MYAKNSPFYGNVPFYQINGSEFITGSDAWNFWSVSGNNPITFPANTVVYSNLTPDEDLRLVSETKNKDNVTAFIGIIDFNPAGANFPLSVQCFRLGDKLTLNAHALKNLRGGEKLTITVTYNLHIIDLPATKLGTITGTNGIPNGTQFTWDDVKYGAINTFTSPAIDTGNTDVEIYDGLNGKVTGNITINITNNSNPANPTTTILTIPAAGPGYGLKLTLTTQKVGWYDSQTIGVTDTDIHINDVPIPTNL